MAHMVEVSAVRQAWRDAQRRVADARRELEEALSAGAAHLGDAHPLMLQLRARLGAVAAEIGNRFEARRNFSIVAEHGPRVLGSTHTAVRVAETYLASNAPKVQAPTASPATVARQRATAARQPGPAPQPPGPASRPPDTSAPPAPTRPGGGPPAGGERVA